MGKLRDDCFDIELVTEVYVRTRKLCAQQGDGNRTAFFPCADHLKLIKSFQHPRSLYADVVSDWDTRRFEVNVDIQLRSMREVDEEGKPTGA